MPASQKVELHNLGIYAEIEPIDHESRLYFTDEEPKFKLTVHNEMDADLSPESSVSWGVGIGEGRPRTHIQGTKLVKVPAHSSRTYEIGGDLLALEGHGVVGVKGGPVREPNSEEPILSSHGLGQSYHVPYSFSVWDRENYETVHERPVRYQQFSVAFAVVVALLGLIQIVLQVV